MNTFLKNVELTSNLTEVLINWDYTVRKTQEEPIFFSPDLWCFPKENTKLTYVMEGGL